MYRRTGLELTTVDARLSRALGKTVCDGEAVCDPEKGRVCTVCGEPFYSSIWSMHIPPEPYSTNGNAMLSLVGDMRKRGYHAELAQAEDGRAWALFTPKGSDFAGGRLPCKGIERNTLPEATAWAALMALEEDIEVG